jgi:hypothetical protein
MGYITGCMALTHSMGLLGILQEDLLTIIFFNLMVPEKSQENGNSSGTTTV